MKRIAQGLLALSLALATPAAGLAKDNAGVTPLQAAPAALRADAAYLLLRTSKAKSGLFAIQHVLLRIPTAQEMDDYRAARKRACDRTLPDLTRKAKDGKVPGVDAFEFDYAGKANSFVVDSGKFLEDGDMRTILFEVPPGTYILYGSTLGGRGLATCNCLGTVSFGARSGVITDIGSLYVDEAHRPSPIAHLEDNLGPSMFQYGLVLGQALVPPDAAALHGLAREPARFEVVGAYYEPGASVINRLAPIPGILGYDRGRAVDLRTGQPGH